MNISWSIFPKFYAHLSVPELAALVREVGLETSNAVVRDGFWATEANLATALPHFVAAMGAEGLKVHFATTDFSAAQLIADATPLQIMAQSGIREFRFGYFRETSSSAVKSDPRVELQRARSELEQLAPLCQKHQIRAVYQVHPNTLVPGPSAAWQLVQGLPHEQIGVEIDPGNQTYEGMENWDRSCRLLRSYVVAMGVKDSVLERHLARATRPDKGWKRRWCPLDEGVINWHEVLRALKGIDFCGTWVFMPFCDEDDLPEMTRKLKRDVTYLRAVVREIEEETP
jgi:sugar phosphate isomerase/epimerase